MGVQYRQTAVKIDNATVKKKERLLKKYYFN